MLCGGGFGKSGSGGKLPGRRGNAARGGGSFHRNCLEATTLASCIPILRLVRRLYDVIYVSAYGEWDRYFFSVCPRGGG